MRKKENIFGKLHSQLELPFLETNKNFLIEIFQILESKFGLKSNSKQKLIDLGSGNGNVVIYAALNYNIKSYGIEIDNNLINEANLRIQSLKKEGNFKKSTFRKLSIISNDFFLLNLKKYDFIYIYSLPTMHRYLKHIFAKAKKGAIIISHKYKIDIFSSFLENTYELTHIDDENKLSTYFYKKI